MFTKIGLMEASNDFIDLTVWTFTKIEKLMTFKMNDFKIVLDPLPLKNTFLSKYQFGQNAFGTTIK